MLIGPSHVNTKPRPPYFTDHSPSTLLFSLYICTCLSLPSSVSLSYLSSHSFLLLSLPLFSLPAVGGSQPNVKRGNLVVSVAFAAFTPTVCPTQKVKRSCSGGAVTCRRTPIPPPAILTPPTAGMEHLFLEKCGLMVCRIKRCREIYLRTVV